MRTFVLVLGGAVLAVGLAAGSAETAGPAGPGEPPHARPAAGAGHRVVAAADPDGHGAAATAARDRSPAECVVVRLRTGQQVLRLQDAETGVRGFRATRLANAVLTPSGKSLPMPVAKSDVRMSRRAPWFRAGASISHVNGAGITGSCIVVSAPDGTLRATTGHEPLRVASR